MVDFNDGYRILVTLRGCTDWSEDSLFACDMSALFTSHIILFLTSMVILVQ